MGYGDSMSHCTTDPKPVLSLQGGSYLFTSLKEDLVGCMYLEAVDCHYFYPFLLPRLLLRIPEISGVGSSGEKHNSLYREGTASNMLIYLILITPF